MTKLQRLLHWCGAWRMQRFRRWVGGRWAERYQAPTPHSWECGYIRWEPCADSVFTADTYAIEQWDQELPKARVTKLPRERVPCCEECHAFGPCLNCSHPWRGCNCGATPQTGPDPCCDREPLGIQYGCKGARMRA